ncbi:hypothetical protein [Methylophaga sp. OBS4]|uniref:hypothetical protein n=1 Tax=Methylophaga sp. OBS4 TaxID=2991935 RepID=UPI0022592B39|nr:hypothetical protein [Methylophaga sp. OBS4]MCX4187492.1 hypothetical protein [Methylophaga sp. OBS4]
MTESITLNTAQLRRIAESPAGSVQLVRTFSDTQTSGSGSLAVYAGSDNAQALTIKRIDLAFEDYSRSNIVALNEDIRAVADISFSSSGVLQGEWRIIDPTVSLGAGSGRILKVIRQSLVSSGQGRTRVVSPKLPTDLNGLYLLAFSVQQTTEEFEVPILRYFVIKEETGHVIAPLPLQTFTPAQDAMLSTETVFSWTTVQKAHAYQVELFLIGEDKPLTGKLVPASESSLNLSAMSMNWLEAGTSYVWQVKAFDNAGNIIAVSSLQRVNTP